MLGACIRQAIVDYYKHKDWAERKTTNARNCARNTFDDAKAYLFSDSLYTFGLLWHLRFLGYGISASWLRKRIEECTNVDEIIPILNSE